MTSEPSLDSSVLAVIPHYRCEEWLADALDGLIHQTRPLDGIVVIDDGSTVPPVTLLRRYPQVTLLASRSNVGPYRLTQQVIEGTDYDAYLFEDADDWSSHERLELLLRAAAQTGAEMVGSFEVQISCDKGSVVPQSFPVDVNAAIRFWPSLLCFQHPTSLVARTLVMRVGGFATGMRFAGDIEFLLRASHVARIVNVPRYCHFRRSRSGSLTSAADTGMRSEARMQVRALLRERALERAADVRHGRPPDLAPLAVAPPVGVFHLMGPSLNLFGGDRRVPEVERVPASMQATTPRGVGRGEAPTVASPLDASLMTSGSPVDAPVHRFVEHSSTDGRDNGSARGVPSARLVPLPPLDPTRFTPNGALDISGYVGTELCARHTSVGHMRRERKGRGLSGASSVLAVIPQHGNSELLYNTLEGLLSQTRAPDGIVVMDELMTGRCSTTVRRFPTVALVAVPRNVSRYSAVRQLVLATGYDAYLFHDAGDWSAPDRLEALLARGEQCDAQTVGSYAVDVDSVSGRVGPLAYSLDGDPLADGGSALHPNLHFTSIVTREVILGVGEPATDEDSHPFTKLVVGSSGLARICTVPRFLYFRRVRESLLAAEGDPLFDVKGVVGSTGEGSETVPGAVGSREIRLTHLLGPELRPASRPSG